MILGLLSFSRASDVISLSGDLTTGEVCLSMATLVSFFLFAFVDVFVIDPEPLFSILFGTFLFVVGEVQRGLKIQFFNILLFRNVLHFLIAIVGGAIILESFLAHARVN